MTSKRFAILSGSFLLFTFMSASAQRPAHDNNAFRTTKTAGIAMPGDWNFGVLALAAMPVQKNETNGFRGTSIGSKLFGQYYFGNIGLGLTAGILPGSISSTALNSFLEDRKFLQTQVNKSNPFNSFLLFGPAARFGNRVVINAEVQAGFAVNSPGAISITETPGQRALYQFGAGEKNLFPAFSGSIGLAYPITATTRFIVHSNYLHTKSTVLLYDPQRGVDVATSQQRNVRMISFGLGLAKSFSSDEAPGAATHRARGLIESAGAGNGSLNGTESCGTVVQTTILADGSVKEMIFACPADAAAYENLRTVTVPKQTQGATFGETVNAGLQASGGSPSNAVVASGDAAERKGWDGTVKGGSVVADAPAGKGIQENGIRKNATESGNDAAESKGWDGTVKGGSVVGEIPSNKGINEAGIKKNAIEKTSDAPAGKGIQENGIRKNATESSNDAAERKGWDGTVKGGSVVADAPAGKGIQENGIRKNATGNISDATERKGWDGTVKGSVAADAPAGKGIQENGIRKNAAESSNDAAERKGWDGTVKGGSKAQDHNSSGPNKTSVSVDSVIAMQKDFLQALGELDRILAADQQSSAQRREQVKTNSRQLNLLLGNYSIGSAQPAVEASFTTLFNSLLSLGDAYQSISNVLKTKHDTAKNSVGNIR